MIIILFMLCLPRKERKQYTVILKLIRLTKSNISNSSLSLGLSSLDANSIFCPRRASVFFMLLLFSLSSALKSVDPLSSLELGGGGAVVVVVDGKIGEGTNRFDWVFGRLRRASEARMCDSNRMSHWRRVWSGGVAD